MKKIALAVAAVFAQGTCALVAIVPAHAQAQALSPASSGKTYAQDLVDRTVARHPELLEMDIHASPADGSPSVIVASKNRQRIGKATDSDDLEVFRTGTPRVEINSKGDQNVEVAIQLRNVSNRAIGTVELTFPYVAGTDNDALIEKAEKIGDEVRRRISRREDLAAPAQLDARIPVDTYAQFLVDDEMAREPGVVTLVLHAKGRTGVSYHIVASNIGRIGKASDASDLEVIRTGKSYQEVSTDGDRLEIKQALADASGATVGEVVVVFPNRGLAGRDALVAQAGKIRDDLSRRIASPSQLYGAYPAAQPREVVQTEYDKQELGNKQTLPMTKAVTSGATLEQASQEGYSEAIKGVAGVTPANSKGSANDSVTIRGIKLNLFSNYRINGGLPIAGVITVPNENKERIETLKGANALMFGVASPAGIINLVTKRAGDRDVTSIAAAGNSFGQFGGSFDVGRRFGPEREVGVRVNFSDVHLENGIRNTGGNGKFVGVGADYRITDRLSLQGDYEFYDKHVLEQAGISLLAPVNGRVPITPVPDPRKFLGGPWEIYNPQTQNRVIRADYVLSDNWKVLAESGRSDASRSRYTVRIGSYDIVTGAGGVVALSFSQQEYKNAFSRLESLGKFNTWFLRHDVTIGMSKTIRDAMNLFSSSGTHQQRQNIFDPIELAFPTTLRPTTPAAFNSSTDIGYYGYDTVSLTDKWKLLLGLRRVKDIEQSGTRVNISHVNSPAYGTLYDILPSLTVFASYMEGLEAGGTAPATAVNVNEILPSAISKQKELGIRDSHIKGLSVSGSAFIITRANAVTDPVTRIFANSGEIEYKGVEMTASWQFLPRWTWNVAGQVLNAKQVSPDPTFNGFWPENTPQKAGNTSVQWRPIWVPGLTLTAGVSGISRRFVNNQEQGTIPGYALYNIGAGYTTRIMSKRVAIQVNVDNLANKRYWNGVQTGTYGIGMDRSVKFNVRVDL